ncbi:energy-coupling factor ABC transporter ATP-binding protein [Sneathiella limimaris]|uniref:energy-coupling factor ABC transporter ATP-binding protein n=1 Tax=Sneathiella limimaris TaxID=1964213 RepID=UPI00146A0DBC|nr:ABC transporter ATP-binding protein [Sneathiella limimaris]
MIKLENVNVSLDGRDILHSITTDLQEQRIGIIGLNGSGKSTFARLLNGLQLPSLGTVSVDGFDTRQQGNRARARVGFVFQNPDNQIVYPIVREDLAFGLKNIGLSKTEAQSLIDQTLRDYKLEHLADRLTHQLSGGEKQMIALLGVLVMRPNYLVLDEPTTLLDLRNKKRLMEHVQELSQRVIMVTHDLELLESFDRVICIHEGGIYADGPPEVVLGAYEELCAQ